MHKADSAATACREINPELRVTLFREPLSPQNAEEVCGGFDVVIDCSDNAPTRYLVNDACVLTGVPLVAGAAVGTEGQLTVYNHAGGPCYRCDPALSSLIVFMAACASVKRFHVQNDW